jgi:hypothetical protein
MAPSRSLRIDWTKEPAPGELDRAIDGAGANHGGRKVSKRRFSRAPEGFSVDGLERARETVDKIFRIGHRRLNLIPRVHRREPFEA